MKKGFGAVLSLFLFSGAMAQEEFIVIESPKNGWNTARLLFVSGRVSLRQGWITLIHNGIPFQVSVQDGRFSRKLASSPGENHLRAEFRGSRGQILSHETRFFSKIPAKKLKILLTWDTDGTYVDLWVKEPSGEICKWNDKETQSGGTLDIGNDYPGYGPQIYTHPDPKPGKYEIHLHYYSDGGKAQTGARVTVVLNEGTPEERMEEYEYTLTATHLSVLLETLTF